MATPSGWRDRGRRGSPGSGSPSEEEGPPVQSNRSAFDPRGGSDHKRPYSPVAETLFRKDLISAMKLPDNEPLEAEDYWTVTDTWKQEWERGVQVPVKPDGLPEPHVTTTTGHSKSDRFTLPKKLICMNTSGSYKVETHQVTPMVLRAEQVCTYDLDNVDQNWLVTLNGERARTGQSNLTETEMERSVEELERQCWEKINSTLRSTDDLETAQDDSIICDVCRSPDSEESNEMVFCDQCNICVHQACYGITTIPSGSWLCRTCTLGIKPPCELCPNKGGAMKSTRTGSKWAHVSCALWIPEVSIGCVEKMEPITKISSIPQSRWSLICVLCKERMGSCIQCSVKTCKTAYHVTCAFKHNLEMRAIIEDESAEDGVKLRSYCQKHSLNSKKKPADDSDSESGMGSRKSTMTAEEKSQARRQKMAKAEKEFYKLVDVAVAAKKVDISEELVDIVYKYWVLKRVAGGNKPLLPPAGEDEVLNTLRGEDTERDKMKKLVSIRQDLEKVRNLAYMVSRREKISRSFVKIREAILEKQLALLADEEPQNQMSLVEMSAVIEANHGPSVYDKMLSTPDCEQYTHDDFEAIISRIAGEIKTGSSQIRRDNPRLDFRKKSLDTPQKEKLYERVFSDTSQSESDDSFIHNVSSKSKNKMKKKSPEKAGKAPLSKAVVGSDSSMSSSEEVAELKKLSPSKPVSSSSKLIYSDSDSDKSETEKTPRGRGRPKKQKSKEAKNHKKAESSSEVRADSDSTQNSMDRPKEVKTKGAMKEFTAADMEAAKKIMEEKKAFAAKNKSKPAYVSSDDDDSVMEVDADPNNDFLLVPQRGAARKAQQKISKAEDKKKKASKAAGLFGSSEDESSAKKNDDSKKGPRDSNKKKQTSTDSESEAEPATKIKAKSKSKHASPAKKEKSKHLSDSVKVSPKDKTKKGVMDFTDSEEESPAPIRKKPSSPKKSSKSTKPSVVDSILVGLSDDSEDNYSRTRKSKKAKAESSEDEVMLAAKLASQVEYERQQSSNFDSILNSKPKSQSESGSESDGEKKGTLFDDFENPVVPLFVPQRRAAKKASAQLSEQKQWKKSQQEAYIKELAQIKAKKAAVVSRGRKGDKKSEPEVSKKAVTRSSESQSSSGSSSSDNSDSDSRGKSPRGRGRSPKSKSAKVSTQKKPAEGKGKGRGKKSPRNNKVLDGKIKSSSALEYLMQRESQINNILKGLDEEGQEQGDGWNRSEESKPSQVTPDKKLKTSEGLPQGLHSPPNSPKGSSDSNSDSDSDDSVIRSIKARKKKESEKQQKSENEPKKTDDDIQIHPPAVPASPDKRASRDNSFSDSGAKRSRRSDSEHGSAEPARKENNSRRLGGRAGDSSDGGMDVSHRHGRDGGSSSRERSHTSSSRPSAPEGQQLRQPTTDISPGQKASIFSPEQSPRTAVDPSRSERGDEREQTGPGSWRSPRDRKQPETLSTKEKVLPAPTKSPSKSPALSRSFGEGSRSSPLQTHRSPAFGRSPARHSQHPLNKSFDSKSLDASKSDLTDPKLTITPNKSDNEPEEERPSIDSRKFSVESKDSDGDSAKSSLPDANVNGLADFSKEDSTDTLDFGDKPSDLRDGKGKEQAPAHKTDEGYVSAEKVQIATPPMLPNSDTNAQDALSKQREMPNFPNSLSNVTSDKFPHKETDKVNPLKPSSRLSTDDSVSSLDLGLTKSTTNAWSELERLSSQSSLQQHLLDDQQRSFQMQQQHGQDQKVVEALVASQQQQHAQYEAFLNQMFNMQRKAGHEITQQQMAYAQQYMKELGYGKAPPGHNQSLDILSQQINYQNQFNQMSYQHYVQQIQAYGGLNKKVQDQTDLQFVSAVQWQQQQEAWQAYQRMGDLEKMTQGGLREMQNLLSQGKGKFSQEQHAQFQKMQAEKKMQEEKEKRKQEEEIRRREEEEKRRRDEEEKRRREEEEKIRREEEEKIRREEEDKVRRELEEKIRREEMEKLRREEEEKIRQQIEKKRLEEEEKIRRAEEEMRRREEEQKMIRQLEEEKMMRQLEEEKMMRQLEEEKLMRQLEEEKRMRLEEEKMRREVEEKRRREEEEKRRQEEEEKRMRDELEMRRREEEEMRLREEEERRRVEKIRQEEEKRRHQEQLRMMEEQKIRDENKRQEIRMLEEQRIMEENRQKELEEQLRINYERMEEQRKKELEEQQRINYERMEEERKKELEEQQRINYERMEENRKKEQEEQQRINYERMQWQRWQQDQFASGHRDLVGQVQDQLGALTGQSLFGLSKEPTSNKGVNNNKNEQHTRGRPVSPRTEKATSCQVEESRREQERLQKQFPQLAFNTIPSATPVDALPGFKPSIPSREHKRQSHEFHQEPSTELKARDRATPQSVTGSDKDSHNSEPSGIPSCLLDSILETAKLPVWKPPDKTPESQNFSPAKPPVPSPPKPAPVTSERDSSFDDLVRHIDSSPSQKPHSKSSKQREHNSASEAASDYDNDHHMLGGVDYDDPYGSSDDQPLKQRQTATKASKKETEEPEVATTLTKRGTKVPCYAEKDDESFGGKKATLEDPAVALAKLKNQPARSAVGRGRARGRPGRGGVFGRRGGPKYDPKAFEKVHKNLAGTDFDFEGEFDDDFGASPSTTEMPTSLKGFREQTKKAPIYMQEGKKDDNFDFDDETKNEQIPPVLSDGEGPEETPKVEVKPVGRARQRRAKRDTEENSEPVVETDLKASKVANAKLSQPKVSLSKIPALKEDSPKKETPKEHRKLVVNLGKKDRVEMAPVAGEESNFVEEVRPRAEEAKRKAEEAKYKAEEAKNKAEQDKRRAEEVKAEEAKAKAEETKAKAEEAKAEKRKAEEAKAKAEEAQTMAQEAKSKAEEAKSKVEEAKSKADESKPKPEETKSKPEPKIPTLKIKFGRTESPASVGSDENEFKSKKHRRSSLEKAKQREERKSSVDKEDDGAMQKVPKLKIRLGQPPPTKPPEVVELDATIPHLADIVKEMASAEVPPLIIKTPTSSPKSARGKVTPRPLDPATGERLSTSELALEVMKTSPSKESPKSSGPPPNTSPSPKKKTLGSIDSLATKLLERQHSTPVNDKTSEMNNIFGPEEPLQVNMGEQQVPNHVERSDDGPSELELLAMELSNQLEKEKQMKKEKDEAARKEKEAYAGLDDDDDIRHHDPKYKFKQLNKPSHSENRNSTSPGPPTPVKINLATSSGMDSNPLRRMRKKELLNQYYGIETVVPVSEAGSNGPSLSTLEEPISYNPPIKMNIMREPPIRNIIKMPKAVASVTSVPTRADYQSQLEANLERKRKREGKEPLPGKGKKGGKPKKEEKEYKPKIRVPADDEFDGDAADKIRKTRGKPPKKRVVEDSDEDDDPKVSFIESKKNESLKFAESILADFDKEGEDGREEAKPERDERRRKEKKKRRREEEDAGSQPNTKTPRIVIKFSKNKDPPKNIPKDNNGLSKPPGQISGDMDMQKKLPKLKIKNLIEPNPS